VDVGIMIIFGFIGYFFRKFRYEGAPLVLALVLGPMMENSLRQALLMANGNLATFFQRPISGALLGAALFLLILPLIPRFHRKTISAE
jgi:putative tricarboxylic transport membrane protein